MNSTLGSVVPLAMFTFNVNSTDAQETRRNAELRSVSERLESVEMALQDRVSSA